MVDGPDSVCSEHLSTVSYVRPFAVSEMKDAVLITVRASDCFGI